MKLFFILLFYLDHHACIQALDNAPLAPAFDGRHPPLPAPLHPAGGAAGEPIDGSDPTHGGSVIAQAARTPDSGPPETVPVADTADATCTAITLGEWVLQHGSSGLCSLNLDDEIGDLSPEHGTATALTSTPRQNASAVQPPAEELPQKDAAEEEAEDEERQNFASAKDGAKIVAANKEAKKAVSLLDDDGDTFLKNECKADKWVIIELAQMVKVDTLKVSQFELYSSRIKDFQLRARLKHPRSEGADYARSLDLPSWQLLGNFTAARAKGTQTFRVTGSPWVKFVQLRFLTHYGAEPVCAVNDVTVHGRGANEDLEELLSTDSDAEVLPLVIPLPSVPLPPADPPPVRSPASNAAAAPEQAGRIAAADVGSANVRNRSNGAGGSQGSAQGSAANAPLLQFETAAEAAGVSISGTAPPKAASRAGDRRSEAAVHVARSNGTSVTAGPERASSEDASGDPAGIRPNGRTASWAPVQLAPAPEDMTSDKAAVSAGQNRPPTAQITASDVTPDSAPEQPVEPVPGSGLPAPAKLVAVPPADAALAKAGARLELEFTELPVGSGRSGGGIYDVLVQELKAIKVQQKAVPRQLMELQAEAAAAMAAANAASAALSAAAMRISQLEADVANASSTMPSAAGQLLLANDPLIAVLQQRLVAAERRQTAMLGALAMLAGFLALNKVHIVDSGRRRLFRVTVVVLSLANGAVGLASLLLAVRWQHVGSS